MTRFFTALMALALGASAALADGLPYRSKIAADDPASFNWTGFYLGIGAGYGHTVGNMALDNAADFATPQVSGNSFGADGWRIPLIGGLDYRFKNTPFVLGVFGTWNPDGWGDSNFSADFGKGEWSGNLALTYSAGVRLGLVMANNNLIYAGYKRQWADLTLANPTRAGSQSLTKSVQGNGIVGGIEMPLNLVGAPIQATFSVEGAYTRFDSTDFTFVNCPEFARIKPDDLSIMAYLKIRTGFFGQ